MTREITMTTPIGWRGLLRDLVQSLDERAWGITSPPSWAEVKAAREALAQPEPEVVGPTRDELWELWLRLDRELPDRPAAVAEFWEHAQIEARARWGRPAPAPAEGEVGELVAWLRAYRDEGFGPLSDDPDARQLTRAANLLCAAALLERQAAPVPVAVSEQPWDRDGWCDESGRCWMGWPGGFDCRVGILPSYRYCRPQDALSAVTSLPAHALPPPSVEVEA